MSKSRPGKSLASRYGYLWVTLLLFTLSLIGHWWFAWYAFVDEQAQHAQTPEVSAFVVQTMRDTLENWQSEFLQLMWQISGLAILYHVGSPQSKEGSDRVEEKIDRILQAVEKDAKAQIARIDRAYQRQ